MSDQQDGWMWVAIYQDQTILPEREDDGTEHVFAEVDKERCIQFCLVGLDEQHKDVIIHVDPEVSEGLFFTRRRFVMFSPHTGTTPVMIPAIHILGCKQGNEMIYFFLFPDGSSLISKNLNAV